MENKISPQKRFEDSTLALLNSWKEMDNFDKQLGDREPNGAERFIGLVKFGDLMVKMLIACRDGDNWLRGH